MTKKGSEFPLSGFKDLSPLKIEDYALIGDTHTAALVGINGSIDWLCLPRFDSGACFAALLGKGDNGYWRLAPEAEVIEVKRRYRPNSLVLETDFVTEKGTVRVTDLMPHRSENASIVRIVQGITGEVKMRMELCVRFDYGWIVPWTFQEGGHLHGIAGPDSICLDTPIDTHGDHSLTIAEFNVTEEMKVPFTLSWHPQFEDVDCAVDAEAAIDATDLWWRTWSAKCTYQGPYRDAVMRSLITLKALTYHPTGGMVAAATTSLPEQLGGSRNWDYRYCWLRDATFTLEALLRAGYREEALSWRDWLVRAAAGDPRQLQIMYGLAGERRLAELELDWLEGYELSAPVRIGNAASDQLQLDVYGEVMDSLHRARLSGIEPDETAWALQRALVEYVCEHWQEPDEGIWEVRSGRRHFTYSKVMAWVAIDRAVQAVEIFGLDGPVEHWRNLRNQISNEICERAVDSKRGCFVQSYDSNELDASLLLIPIVGFLPATDERVLRTTDAIQKELCEDGLVMRYQTCDDDDTADGLPGEEGYFIACSFWLIDNLVLAGRDDEARNLFERVLDLRNDVGLLSEEYSLVSSRMLGNFPQSFSHVGVVNSAFKLAHVLGLED